MLYKFTSNSHYRMKRVWNKIYIFFVPVNTIDTHGNRFHLPQELTSPLVELLLAGVVL